jgi:hypothetical protein
MTAAEIEAIITTLESGHAASGMVQSDSISDRSTTFLSAKDQAEKIAYWRRRLAAVTTGSTRYATTRKGV